MSDLIEKLRSEFQHEEYRHAYAEECLNTIIATQMKVLREQREMTQGVLAQKCGMKQPRIPLLEDANYSNWTIKTLKRLARAFDVALTVRFDAFSDLILDFECMSKESLQRPSFNDDPLFRSRNVTTSRRFRRHRHTTPNNAAVAAQMNLPLTLAKMPALQPGSALHRHASNQGGQYAARVGAAS